MKWLVVIWLVLNGSAPRDGQYEAACTTLDGLSAGRITCERLEAWWKASRRDDAGEEEGRFPRSQPHQISNGF